ncbi:MAG: dUTP diphosphatase, partial [Fusobacteriaceae bacterium]
MKPTNLFEVKDLQTILDLEVAKKRPSGFQPRQRFLLDTRFSLDDELNEFVKELPDAHNFKTWKEKVHSPEKQLEEWVDCLFFIMQGIEVGQLAKVNHEVEIACCNGVGLLNCALFKESVMKDSFTDILIHYLKLSGWLGYTTELLINTYYDKWCRNMNRINGDWSI